MGAALKDSRFVLALTAASAPVAGHLLGQYWHAFFVFWVVVPLLDRLIGGSAQPASAAEIGRLERNPFFRLVLHAWVPLQLALIAWGAWLVGSGRVAGIDAAFFTLSVGLATGGVGITIAHELGHKRPALDRLLSRALAGSSRVATRTWWPRLCSM
jgi:alkane 1-monooxygenase